MNPNTQTTNRRGINTLEASQYLGISVALLKKDRTQREPQIPYSKICGRVVYFPHRLDEYIAKQEVGQVA